MNYEQKYLKYKAKYIKLKQEYNLLQSGSSYKFINAIKENKIDLVKSKLEGKYSIPQKLGFGHPANPNQIDQQTGKTGLILALELKYIDMANLLLDYKADPNIYPQNNYLLSPILLISSHLLSYPDNKNYNHTIPKTYIKLFERILKETNMNINLLQLINGKLLSLYNGNNNASFAYLNTKFDQKMSKIKKNFEMDMKTEKKELDRLIKKSEKINNILTTSH
jgi:hypothetical protein